MGLSCCAGNIVRVAFQSNSAGQQGGALFSSSSSGNILNSTFTSNKAGQARSAAYLHAAVLACPLPKMMAAFACAFHKAWHVRQAGGAVFQNAAASSISFCIFSGNSAGTGSGGALYRNACQGFTINCSFISNDAAEGGAIYQNNCVSNNIR